MTVNSPLPGTILSSLPTAVSLDGSEEVPIVQGGTTKRTTTGDIGNTATGFVPTTRVISTPGPGGLTGGGTLATELTLQWAPVNLNAKTAMVVADTFAINDSALNTPAQATFPNAMKALTGLSALVLPSATDDYLIINRASDGQTYKINPTSLGLGTGDVPAGGTIGQPLVKNSSTNFDSSWQTLPVIGGGTGQITNTNHGVLLGQGANAIVATVAMTGGQLLIGQTGADPAPETVSGDVTISNLGVTAIGNNKVTDAMLRQSVGLSVIGRSASTTGNVADVVGTSDQVLRIAPAGASLGFGSIDLSAAATVGTSVLVATNGGTSQSTYMLGDTLYSNGVNTLAKLSGNTTAAIQYLSQTGTGVVSAAPAWATIAGGDITGAALTKADDTNVTLTLGGSPTTALLRATSITAGWTGQLGLTRGGTNASLTASIGGLVYSDASALAVLAGTATANQIPLSGLSAAPSWSTATYPSTAAAKSVLNAGTANVISSTTTPTIAGLTVNNNVTALPTSVTGTVIQAGNVDGAPTAILVDSFGTSVSSQIIGRNARGTAASPTATQNGDVLIQDLGFGRGATAYSSAARASVSLLANENWSDSAQGTRLEINLTPNSSISTANVASIGSTGGFIIPNTVTGGSQGGGTINVSGGYYVGGAPITPTTAGAAGTLLRGTGTSTAPTWSATPTLGIPGSALGTLSLAGNTSGAVLVTPQAAAGATTLTLPNTSGTVAASATAPITLNATTGAIGITASALTKTDDTNVTLALAGSPTTALLAATSLTLGWTGTLSLTRGGTGANLSATGGTSQVLQQSSAGAAVTVSQLATSNLSDYVEGTWTPVITFATPGDVAVTYSLREGNYIRIGHYVTLTFNLVTSAFTYTTASGNLQITGIPFANANATGTRGGALTWSGITKAGYTQLAVTISTLLHFTASGSGVGTANVTSADTATGTNLDIRGTVMYFIP